MAAEIDGTQSGEFELSESIDPNRGDAPLSEILGEGAVTPGQTLGRYVLLRELGRGAIGVVYAAYHEGLDRKLAIKVLNRSRAGRKDFEARLLREARALARLSHPNVVQVYDVGELDGRVFVVMEFVEGVTLSEWMQNSRSVDEVLELFSAVGRGLAAAHAAGVVHRDFKPDNVIVSVDGRPRVLDFGLAREVSEASEATERDVGARQDQEQKTGPRPVRPLLPAERDEAGDAIEQTLSSPDLAGPLENELSEGLELTRESNIGQPGRMDQGLELTRTGAQVGTPAYMSPEQFMALTATPASDQFAFCVVLHEAIYGCRPYTAKTKSELMVQVHAGAIVEERPSTEQPKWLRALIVRGLSPNPRERWPSMDAMLGAIHDRPREQRRRLARRRRGAAALVIAGLSVAAGVGVGLRDRTTREPTCPSIESLATELWTPAQAEQVAASFANSKLGYADAAWSVAQGRLELWVETWAAQRRTLCELETQPPENASLGQHLDLRQACLGRARRGFEALYEQFSEADATVVEHAVEAVAGLPDPLYCAQLEAHVGELEAPPETIAAEVRALREQLTELDTRRNTGRWRSGLALAKVSVERGKKVGYGPVLAEALFTHGRLQARAGASADIEEALVLLQDALDEAERSGHEALAPIIATELVSLSIYAMPDPVRGRLWSRRVQAGLDRVERTRAGVDDELGLARARAAWAQGNLERLDGDNAEAEQQLRSALDLLEHHAEGHPERGVMLNDLGNVLNARGERDAARAVYEQALAQSLASYGEGHPRVGNAHYNLARLARDEGELELARAESDKAFVIYAAARGSRHRDVGDVELLRAAIALAGADPIEGRARALEAQAIYDAALAEDNVDRAEPYQMLGHAAFMLEQLEPGLVEYQRALAIKQRALPPDHIELEPTLTNMGLILFILERYAEAIVPLEQAVRVLEAGDGVDPEHLRLNRLYLGDALLGLGRPSSLARAAAILEQAALGCVGDASPCSDIRTKLAQARGSKR